MSFAMGYARTNLFRVVNEEAFHRWAEACGFEVVARDGFFGLTFEPEDVWATALYPATKFLVDGQSDDDEEEEHGDFELIDELAHFLQPGSIAVLYRAGGDSHGEVFGDATAVNAEGKSLEVSLTDIVKRARAELGGEVKDWGPG